MKRKKLKEGEAEPVLVDQEKFTDAIRRMVNTQPIPLKKLRRRKNPYHGPEPIIPPQKS